MTERKNPGVAFWATVVVAVVLMAYPLSFGPFCRMVYNGDLSDSTTHGLTVFYQPMYSVHDHAPRPINNAIEWYCGLWL